MPVQSNHKKKEAITKRRKRQIIAAAREVFSQKGFSEATTAEIAQQAGVSEGTIYNYF
ncbi:MAG: helix-turn-helix transcriptional regulator, partial [Anaerolineales bacterium]|nr:helix-turn-helix transcriptional regulator [Anaerolineales bacterium]